VLINPQNDAQRLGGGGPILNSLAAALMQGAMPDQTGAPPSATGGQLLQTGGAVPGAVPLGAPTNQFGNVPSTPGAGPQALPIARPVGGAPVAQPIGGAPVPLRPPAGPLGGGVMGVPMASARPFGFGGYNRNGY
jgi:hypothetical protein